jgi:hypothetical protein
MREHENVDTKHTQGDRRFADSPVEGTGFEPPVLLLPSGRGVAGKRR